MRFGVRLQRRVIFGVACVLLCTKSAYGSEGDARERSAALFRDGLNAGKAGDYARAEVAFRTSYLLVQSPSTLRNWALTEMRLGKMVEALGHLKRAIQWTGWSAEQRAIVQQNLDDAYAATGHITVQTTQGAEVAVDGVLAEGAAPFDAPLDVTAGRRLIDARLGSATAHTEVDAPAGTIVDVSVPVSQATREVPAAAPPAPTVQPPTPELEPPRAALTADREPPRASWWTTPHAVAVGLAGVAAAGVGLGLTFDAAAHAAATDASTLRAALTGQCAGGAAAPGCASLRDKIGALHEDEVLEDVAFAVGAAAGVGAAIVLAVLGPRAAPRTGSVQWTPMIAPGAAGVAGSF